MERPAAAEHQDGDLTAHQGRQPGSGRVGESVLFLMPPALKLASVLFYLESLLPFRPKVGPIAILAQPPPVIASVAGMLLFAAAVLALAAWRASRMEISYSTD